MLLHHNPLGPSVPILVVLIKISGIIQSQWFTSKEGLNEIRGHGYCASNESIYNDFE